METWPAARLTMEAGIKKGDTLRGPPASRLLCSRSITSKPPMPLPMCTPTRGASSSETWSPEPAMASAAAASANWMKSPIFLSSFFSMKTKGSKPFTSAAKRQLYWEASKWVMGPTPLRPASSPAQVSGAVRPTAEIRPTPVTTTRWRTLSLGTRFGLDVVNGVLDATDLLRILVRDLDLEGTLEFHNQLDQVERIGAEILNEGGSWGNFTLLDAELLDHDLTDLFFDASGHCVRPPPGSS